jgi:hypothetical protein
MYAAKRKDRQYTKANKPVGEPDRLSISRPAENARKSPSLKPSLSADHNTMMETTSGLDTSANAKVLEVVWIKRVAEANDRA